MVDLAGSERQSKTGGCPKHHILLCFFLFVGVHVDVYNRVFLQSSGDATLELASAAH